MHLAAECCVLSQEGEWQMMCWWEGSPAWGHKVDFGIILPVFSSQRYDLLTVTLDM